MTQLVPRFPGVYFSGVNPSDFLDKSGDLSPNSKVWRNLLVSYVKIQTISVGDLEVS